MKRKMKTFLIRVLSLCLVLSFLLISNVVPGFAAGAFSFGTTEKELNTFFIENVLSSYDLMAFENVYGLTHVEGAVAIQGNYSGQNGLSMATHTREVDRETITLLVGGHIDANNYVMSCESGCIGYINEPNIPGYLLEKSYKLPYEEVIKFFVSEEERFKEISNQLSQLSNNVEVNYEYGRLEIYCNQEQNVCNIIIDENVNYNEIKIYGYGNLVVNLICIGAPSIKMTSYQSIIDQVIFNVVGEATIDFSNGNIEAAILGLDLDIIGDNGYIGKSVICKNLTSNGSFEIHHNSFNFCEQPEVSDSDVVSNTDVPSDSDITTEPTTTTTIPSSPSDVIVTDPTTTNTTETTNTITEITESTTSITEPTESSTIPSVPTTQTTQITTEPIITPTVIPTAETTEITSSHTTEPTTNSSTNSTSSTTLSSTENTTNTTSTTAPTTSTEPSTSTVSQTTNTTNTTSMTTNTSQITTVTTTVTTTTLNPSYVLGDTATSESLKGTIPNTGDEETMKTVLASTLVIVSLGTLITIRRIK